MKTYPTYDVVVYDPRTKTDRPVRLELRPHGKWKFVDFFLIGIWAYLGSLWPPFRRRFWKHVYAVSTKTRTVYMPQGPVQLTPAFHNRMYHEAWHVLQTEDHGWLKHHARNILLARWRIWNEAEAYALMGTDVDDAVDSLMAGAYFVFWNRKFVRGVVAEAFRSMVSQEEA